jgi:Flp pilus assembly CpaF family ATPase
MIARVVDVLVFMERNRENGRRRVLQVARVLGVNEENDSYLIEDVPG